MPIHNILECINNFPVVLFDFFIFGIYGIKTHETIYDMFCDDAFVIFCIFVSAYTHATRQKQDEAAQTMGSFMAQVM